MKHLKVGGSTAARTLNCPGWLTLVDKVPKPKSNDYADEGNLLHDCMEDHYMEDKPFIEMLGMKYEEQVLTRVHLPILELAKSATEQVLNDFDVDEFTCEPFVQLIEDEVGGSIDMIGLSSDRKTLVLLDYKFGAYKVIAEHNKQLAFYGMCAKEDKKTRDMFKDVRRVVFAIVQPKISATAEVWTIAVQYIDDFKHELLTALEGPAHFKTGKHCDFCPCAPLCPEKKIVVPDFLLKSVANFEAMK